MKKRLLVTLLAISILNAHAVHAQGIPVIDSANLAQAIQQVTAWGQQYQQMQQQLSNASGIRNMGNIAQTVRVYLPLEYQQMLNQGIGAWEAIYSAARIFDMSLSRLASSSDASQAMIAIAQQAAINRAAAEEAYRTDVSSCLIEDHSLSGNTRAVSVRDRRASLFSGPAQKPRTASSSRWTLQERIRWDVRGMRDGWTIISGSALAQPS